MATSSWRGHRCTSTSQDSLLLCIFVLHRCQNCQTPVLIVILVTRQAAAEAEYEVSIFGGYEDENSTSEDITESLLMAMQVTYN